MEKQKRFRDASLRLQSYDYSQPGYYFITICTKNREHIFGSVKDDHMRLNDFGMLANDYWNQIEKRYPQCRTKTFVVMPNHIHGIIEIILNPKPVWMINESSQLKNDQSISKPVGSIHELSLRSTNDIDIQSNRKKRRKMILPMVIGWYKMNVSKQINIVRQTSGSPIWQRNYYEHIIRNQESYQSISEYIRLNPQKWNRDRFNG